MYTTISILIYLKLQGRETKTKSVKKQIRNTSKSSVTEEIDVPEKKSLEIISVNDIADIVGNKLEEEGLDDLIEPISKYFHPSMNAKGLEIAANLYLTTIVDRNVQRRQTHNELQEKLNLLVGRFVQSMTSLLILYFIKVQFLVSKLESFFCVSIFPLQSLAIIVKKMNETCTVDKFQNTDKILNLII